MAQWRAGISCLWKFRIVAWLTRVNRGGSRLDLPPPPLTGCSHFVLMAHRSVRRECLAMFEKIRGRDHSPGCSGGRRSHCQLWRRCACGFARDSDRERVPGGRNQTIDRSNLDGLRAGPDAQGTSTDHEDLEASVVVTITIYQLPIFCGRSGWRRQPPSFTLTSMRSMHRSSNCLTRPCAANPSPLAAGWYSPPRTKPSHLESVAVCQDAGLVSCVRS